MRKFIVILSTTVVLFAPAAASAASWTSLAPTTHPTPYKGV